MIEKYYASHIEISLDAVAIKVMRPKKKRKSNGRGVKNARSALAR